MEGVPLSFQMIGRLSSSLFGPSHYLYLLGAWSIHLSRVQVTGASKLLCVSVGTKKRGINPAQRKKLLAAIREKLPGAS